MESRIEDVVHRKMRAIVKSILSVIVAVPPVFYASIGDQAYATNTRSTISLPFQQCATGARKACVVDGDTIWLDGQKIRSADIDAPEVSEPKCSSELVLQLDSTC
jgi:endonuclease YncB( thermonuclease family)